MTVKQVKKKQKHKSKGSVRTITKQVKADSFFNFFDPPAVPDDPNAEVDEDTQVKYLFIVIKRRTLSKLCLNIQEKQMKAFCCNFDSRVLNSDEHSFVQFKP